MKSDLTAARFTPRLTRDAFQAFFEALEHPAALCDQELNLLATNSAFEGLGPNLGEVLQQIAGSVPADGDARDVDVQLGSGQQVTLTLSRRGDTVAVVARNLAQAAAVGSLAAAGRAIVEHARVEKTLLEVGREVAGAMSEEELVAVVARGVKSLFAGRSFCVRIADQRTLQLTSLYAEGRMREGAPDVMVFKRSAAEKTHLKVDQLSPDRVRITDDEVPLMFHGTTRSLCAPLVASGQLLGVLNVEYPPEMSADLEADNHLLIQLANQVAVGIRNAKLIDELTFVRKYLEELLEHANAAILVADRERRIVVFNKNISQLTGLRREEVLGQDLLTFIPESEKMRMMRVIAASLRGEQVANFETRVLGVGGREVRVSFASSAVLTARGEVEGMIAIGQDLTVVKELERRVIQAEKLASLGQLAASVVHEINNPMTAVVTYADALLQRARLNPAAEAGDQEKLRKILENCHRILRFTRNLVSYARPADDKPEEVDLHQLLDLAVSFCDHVLHHHQVTVERGYGEVPPISAVRGNLVQVFVNLITNACHAMQPGGVVSLRTLVEGNAAVVRVGDVGTGIKAEHLDKIFEPFFTTKPDGKGTGLGLSIVQGIVEKHGGTVSVASEMGRGTTFTIRLPLTSY
jgi:PAS domain S-box-containing protein